MDVFDIDSAVFEPLDIWERYLDPEYRVAARSSFYHRVSDSGAVTVIVNGKAFPAMNQGALIRQAIYEPGMTPDEIGDLDPRAFRPITPGAYDPTARLKDMDAMGIGSAVLFPTVFAEYFPLVDNPDVAYALARAYNDWIWDFSRAAPDRLLPAAVLPLQDAAFAADEADRVADKGFKAAAVRPAFVGGRYLNHPAFKPVFTALEERGIVACIRPSPGGTNPDWTSQGHFIERVAGNLQIGHNVAEAAAPMMDNATALTAFAFSGFMEDYPNLGIAFVHGGASWLPMAFEKLEGYLTLMPSGIKDLSLEPERVFRERPTVISFDAWESSVAVLYDEFEHIGAWGSRYPAHDTMPPGEAIDNLRKHGAPGEVIERLMSGNAARCFGLE